MILQNLENILEGLEDFKSWWKANKDSEIFKDYMDTNGIKKNEYNYCIMEDFAECVESLMEIIDEAPTWTQEELEEFIKEEMELSHEEASIAIEKTLNGGIVFTNDELITLRDFVTRNGS